MQSDNTLTKETEYLFRRSMKTVDADVWVFTETWLDFSPAEGYKLATETSKANDLSANRRWAAIWVKSSLDVEPQFIQRNSDRMVCTRISKLGHQDVIVVGTVLPWPGDSRHPTAAEFCKALKDQVILWSGLWGTPRTSTFVVAGDFNQSLPRQGNFGSVDGERELLNALKLHDLFCLTPGNDPLTNTPRIDHICVSRNGLQPPFFPEASTWNTPCIGEKKITDHSGAYVDLVQPHRL